MKTSLRSNKGKKEAFLQLAQRQMLEVIVVS